MPIAAERHPLRGRARGHGSRALPDTFDLPDQARDMSERLWAALTATARRQDAGERPVSVPALAADLGHRDELHAALNALDALARRGLVVVSGDLAGAQMTSAGRRALAWRREQRER